MKRNQNYKCKICGETTKLAVDHDHKTYAIRGLLCRNCNTGLGCFKDNPQLLLSAIDYLKDAPKKPDWRRMLKRL